MNKFIKWINELINPRNPNGLYPWLYETRRYHTLQKFGRHLFYTLDSVGTFELLENKYLVYYNHSAQAVVVEDEVFIRRVSSYQSSVANLYNGYLQYDTGYEDYFRNLPKDEYKKNRLILFERQIHDADLASQWYGYPSKDRQLIALETYATKGAIFPARYGEMLSNMAFHGKYLLRYNYNLYSISEDGEVFKVGELPDYRGLVSLDMRNPENFCAWYIARYNKLHLPKNIDILFTKSLVKVLGG
jgi:hypothetical protein